MMTEAVQETVDESPDVIGISDEAIDVFGWVFIVVLCQIFDLFGIVMNIINIICFVRQGFKEPVNISLFGLAISDLGCLVTHICVNSLYTCKLATPDLTFVVLDFAYLAGGIPHFAFSRVNSWITALITLERCLCITIPLKIKSLITTKRMWILIGCFFVTFLFSGSPLYAVNTLGMVYSPLKNKTLFGIVGTANREQVEGITLSINSFIIPFIAFVIIIISTSVLVVNLQKRSEWRKSATQADLSTREQKVAKMVVMISALFIFSFVPACAMMFSIAFEPELQVGGKYINISTVLGFIGLLLESVNSSSNIFIYYHMSKKYRDTFNSLFCRNKVNGN